MRELVDVQERARSALSPFSRLSARLLAVGYLATTAAYLLLGPHITPGTALRAALLVSMYAVACRMEFEATAGSALPTQPVLVGMLLTLPLSLVPLAVLLGVQAGGVGAQESDTWSGNLLVRTVGAWHCLGPVAVLALAGSAPPSLSRLPLYVLALAAQFAVDAGVAVVRGVGHGVPPARLLGPLSWTLAIDCLLAPIGLCIVIAVGDSIPGLLLLSTPVALLRLLSRDRVTHLQEAVALSTAYVTVQGEARVDALTGLANRRAWDETLEEVTERRTREPDTRLTVVIADLDGLKRVNDTHGHEAGDELICAMADVLRRVLPQARLLARLGGDEYGVLIVTRPGDDAAERLVDRLRSAIAIHAGVRGCALSASIGVAVCPPLPSAQEAARIADERAFVDKRSRRRGRG